MVACKVESLSLVREICLKDWNKTEHKLKSFAVQFTDALHAFVFSIHLHYVGMVKNMVWVVDYGELLLPFRTENRKTCECNSTIDEEVIARLFFYLVNLGLLKWRQSTDLRK